MRPIAATMLASACILSTALSSAYAILHTSDPHFQGDGFSIEELGEIEHERSLGLSEALIQYRHRPKASLLADRTAATAAQDDESRKGVTISAKPVLDSNAALMARAAYDAGNGALNDGGKEEGDRLAETLRWRGQRDIWVQALSEEADGYRAGH